MPFGEKRQVAQNPGENDHKTKKQVAARSSIALSEVVALVHAELSLFLKPKDACSLLLACSRSLQQNVRDIIATEALLYYYQFDSVHFGDKCPGDYHQLVPQSTRGARGPCACNFDLETDEEIVPDELPLPKVLDARTKILQAMCLLYEGIEPHCFKVLQVVQGTEFCPATLQPVVFSLAEGLEKERSEDNREEPTIDTDNVAVLTRLMDVVEPGFGSVFFSSTDANCQPIHVLEAHWKGIEVDPSSGATSCQFCEHYGESLLFVRNPGETTADTDKMMRLHCEAVYQPMKKFMLAHLKHVRYVCPPPGWNQRCPGGGSLMGLVAGITPTGVLCGVYVTNVGIPRQWIEQRLAPGHFTAAQAVDVATTNATVIKIGGNVIFYELETLIESLRVIPSVVAPGEH
ncbi:hypothetical protein JG687_00017067 [Phytophthora cactorum]|uniref:Uncharacterized protein n=2 Tax=Phytophthora cactorum TaxID=29920 RepID=A0A8T1TSX5_9STRA|nr:hypothetical protein JG687_00017067 [Phytophthora cactorum]